LYFLKTVKGSQGEVKGVLTGYPFISSQYILDRSVLISVRTKPPVLALLSFRPKWEISEFAWDFSGSSLLRNDSRCSV